MATAFFLRQSRSDDCVPLASERGPRRVVCLSTRMGSVRNLEWETFIISLASLSLTQRMLTPWILGCPRLPCHSKPPYHTSVSPPSEKLVPVSLSEFNQHHQAISNLKMNCYQMLRPITWWRQSLWKKNLWRDIASWLLLGFYFRRIEIMCTSWTMPGKIIYSVINNWTWWLNNTAIPI